MSHPSLSEVDEFFDNLSERGIKKLAFFFHGGLTPEESGMAGAELMAGRLREAGSHTVSFIWDTGLLETIRSNLDTVSHTRFFERLVAHVLKAVLVHIPIDGGRGSGQRRTLEDVERELRTEREPFPEQETAARMLSQNGESYFDDLEVEMRGEIESELEDDEIIRASAAVERPQMVSTIIPQDGEAGGRGLITWAALATAAAKAAYCVLRRYHRGRDHGLCCTVVEETLRTIYADSLIKSIWAGMKSKAERMFYSNAGRSGDEQHVGTYIMQRLARAGQEGQTLHVDLIGHSAGSIAICHLLRAVARDRLSWRARHIIFLAPACTMGLLQQEVAPYPGIRFRSFRLYAMSDELESLDPLVPFAYPRSLLYLVSGLLEEEADHALAGMERFMRPRWPFDTPALRPSQEFLNAECEGRVILSGTVAVAGVEPHCTATSHGGFADDQATLASVVNLIEGPD